MKVSDYIIEFFISNGITDVFGYPGGMVTHFMESFHQYRDKISAHVNYHEQGAAFAACGYAQVSHKPGIAYATSGPGATNLITGIANAYFDSIPCMFITGQVNTYEAAGDLLVRQRGFQETDIVEIVKPITKYAVQITDESDIRYELEKAYYLCLEGRPGAVLLDIPMNIQRQEIVASELKGYQPAGENVTSDSRRYEVLIKELKKSKRPCLLVGAGIKNSGLVEEFRKFASILGIPVVSSMISVDVVSKETSDFFGFIGAYGHRAANFIVAKCDLLISIGSRLDVRQTGSDNEKFAPKAKLIRIDVDPKEMTNLIKEDEIQIVDQLSPQGMKELTRLIKTSLHTDYKVWKKTCNEIVSALKDVDKENATDIVKELSRNISDNSIITTDVGQNQVWIPQVFEFKENQTALFSGGHGAMGYSLPAAIGAYYASHKTIYCFTGDGGIQMNIQELQFIARERLPIKVIILNNKALGMIRHFQEMYFDSNYYQTMENGGYSAPDFGKIAYAYGLPYYKVACDQPFVSELLYNEESAIIEVILDNYTYVFPKLSMNRPCQDQEPLIDRALYQYLMDL
jgi:acetolactate synthase-1/2/3 large subunit